MTDNGTDTDVALPQTVDDARHADLYKVVMLNDDYTPMDFVVEVLEAFFDKSPAEANRLMMLVHLQGHAVCGYYTWDVAQTKVAQVRHYAIQHEHPLMCTLEEA